MSNLVLSVAFIIMALFCNANDLIRGEWYYHNIYQVFLMNGLAIIGLWWNDEIWLDREILRYVKGGENGRSI